MTSDLLVRNESADEIEHLALNNSARVRKSVSLLQFPDSPRSGRAKEPFWIANGKAKLTKFILQRFDILTTRVWFEIFSKACHIPADEDRWQFDDPI
jgi:hypothetical protein